MPSERPIRPAKPMALPDKGSAASGPITSPLARLSLFQSLITDTIRAMNITNSALRNPDTFATTVAFDEKQCRYIYTLLLTEAESDEVTRLAHHGYDCSIDSAALEASTLADGMVAYQFDEPGAHEVYEAYGDLDSALATCGMQSLMIKVQGFVECVV